MFEELQEPLPEKKMQLFMILLIKILDQDLEFYGILLKKDFMDIIKIIP